MQAANQLQAGQGQSQRTSRYRLIHWLRAQFRFHAIIKTFLVLCFFGLIPGGWIIGFPIFVSYGGVRLYWYTRTHSRLVRSRLRAFILTINEYWQYTAQLSAERFAQYIVDNPWNVIKTLLTVWILFTWLMPFSFFSLYGLYRYTNEEWAEIFGRRFGNIYDATLGLILGATHRLNFTTKVIVYLVACLSISALIHSFGMFGAMLDLAISLLELCATSVGLTAITRDIGYFFRNPLQVLTDYPGRFYGLVWGRWLAFLLFPGRVVGTMGPASGHVDGAGFFVSLFNTLFPASSGQGWFTFGSGLGGFLTSRFVSFFNSVFTSVFFSYNMRLQGDFYGTLGPTSFQIFLCMTIGFMLGYVFEGLSNRLYEVASADGARLANYTSDQIFHGLDLIYRYRWHIGYLAVMVPLVLASPSSAVFYSLGVGGNVLAAVLATLTGAASLAAIQLSFRALYWTYDTIFSLNSAPRAGVPNAPLVPAQNVALAQAALEVGQQAPPLVMIFNAQQANAIEVPQVVFDPEPVVAPIPTP